MEPSHADSASATSHDQQKDIKSNDLGVINSVSPGEMNDTNRMPESLRELSSEELARLNKKLVRKMDLVILPIIGILYILNYIDRQNLSAAKLQGITDDLHMSTQQFATAISILFVGYLPFQIPSNLLITRIPRPGMYICTATVIWGGISGATAAVQTYQQLLAVRVILGIVEAVFFPGAVYFLSTVSNLRDLSACRLRHRACLSSKPILTSDFSSGTPKENLASVSPVSTSRSKSVMPSEVSLQLQSSSSTVLMALLVGDGFSLSKAVPLSVSVPSVFSSCPSIPTTPAC